MGTHLKSVFVAEAVYAVGVEKLFFEFEDECDAYIESNPDEGTAAFYRSAHMNSLVMATGFALWELESIGAPQPAGVMSKRSFQAVIKEKHAHWAIAKIKSEVELMVQAELRGDLTKVGDDEVARALGLKAFKFLLRQKAGSDDVRERREQGVFIQSDLQLSRTKEFAAHKLGARRSIALAFELLVKNGQFRIVSDGKKTTNGRTVERYGLGPNWARFVKQEEIK